MNRILQKSLPGGGEMLGMSGMHKESMYAGFGAGRTLEMSDPGHGRDPDVIEDRLLFRGGMVRTKIQMHPIFGENDRGEWLVSAEAEDRRDFQVVFSGRRIKAARDLRNELAQAWTLAQRISDTPDPLEVRLPVLVDGAWRALFRRDQEGWETRQFQLVAARWSFMSRDGTVSRSGEEPRFGGAPTRPSNTAPEPGTRSESRAV